MTTKLLDDAQFKATQTSAKTRVLDFYAATFNTVPDKSFDMIDPHAFDQWLKDFYAAGKPLPISFAHSAVLDSTDPYNIIGSAPADPDHVWTDDFGLRVKATLNVGSNDTARYVADLIDQGIITGASIAFTVTKEVPDKENAGATRIMQMQVKEAGPCLSPANEEAVVLALKAVRDELRGDTETKPEMEMKTPPWHIEKRDGQFCVIADETNAVVKCHPTNAEAMAHMGALYANVPDAAKTEDASEETAVERAELAIKHASSPAHLQAAHDALVRAGAKCASVGEVVKTVESAEREVQDRLRNLRWLEKGLV